MSSGNRETNGTYDLHDNFDRWFAGLGNPAATANDQATTAIEAVEQQKDSNFSTVADWEQTLTAAWPEPLAEPSRQRPMRPRRLRRPGRVALATSAGAVTLAGALLYPSGDDETAPLVVSAAGGAALSAIKAVPSDPRCPSSRDGATVTGSVPDGSGDGPDVVMRFQKGYYQDRSGATARTVVAADAAVPAAEVIQQGIDATPNGTWHCLVIVGLESDRFAVELTEHRPDGAVNVYKQLVTTAVRDGRTVITSIAQG